MHSSNQILKSNAIRLITNILIFYDGLESHEMEVLFKKHFIQLLINEIQVGSVSSH